MNTVKILHSADIHIGAAESFLGKISESRRMETLLTFERIMDLAVEQDIKVIALAGDIFNSNNIEEKYVTSVFDKIRAVNPIKVVYAAGNHDPLNAESPFKNHTLPQNLYVLGTEDECITFEDLKLKVYGRSFETASLKGEEEFSLKTDENYINILVQHGELKSDLNSEYNAITPKYVKNCGMDYIALGHVHQRTETGKIGSTYFAYCGCPEGQGFDETDQKGVYIGEIGKGICNLQFFPTAKRQHICKKIDITGTESSAEISADIINLLSEEYKDGYKENLYKLILVGEITPDNEPDIEEISARISNEVYFVKIKDSTEYSLNLEALAEEKSLKGIFVKKMLEKMNLAEEEQKENYKKALRLGLKAFKGEVKYNED